MFNKSPIQILEKKNEKLCEEENGLSYQVITPQTMLPVTAVKDKLPRLRLCPRYKHANFYILLPIASIMSAL